MKNVAVLTEDRAFALFFGPHPGGFDSSRVPTPGIFHPRPKNGNARGGGGGGGFWAHLELTDACINSTRENKNYLSINKTWKAKCHKLYNT